jgi:hypothetical protein
LVVRGLSSDSDTHLRLARCFGEIEAHRCVWQQATRDPRSST